MWKLEIYRVITNVAAWQTLGTFAEVHDLLRTISECYNLEARVIDPNGQLHQIDWIDDPKDSDYCVPVIGKVCNTWPQFVGNVK